MSDQDPPILVTLLGDLGSSLYSSTLSAITEPLVGWLSTYIGFGGNAGNGDYTTLLGNIQTILTDIGNLQADVQNATNQLLNALDAGQMQAAVNAAQSNPPPANYGAALGFLDTIHSNLVGPIMDGGLPGSTASLKILTDPATFRYYSDNSPYYESNIIQYFLFYKRVQTILMQMAVELAHAGQGLVPPAAGSQPVFPPGTWAGYPPPNYEAAAAAYALCSGNLAEQASFLPFPTAGIQSSATYQPSGPTGPVYNFGLASVVVERKPDVGGQPVAGLVWGAQTLASPPNFMASPVYSTVPAIQRLLPPVSGSIRLPAFQELIDLRMAVGPAGMQSAIIAMEQLGFSIPQYQIGSTGNSAYSLPMITAECLNAANWTMINQNPYSISHRMPPGTKVADGWTCGYFYDIGLGSGVSVNVYVPVTVPLQGVFTDIQSATSVTASGFAAPLNGYLDALLVYTPQITDGPLEEPSGIQITAVGPQSGPTTQFTATGNFQRFDPSFNALTTIQIPITQVYWRVDLPSVATIDQTGLLTWKTPGTVNVTAVRNAQPPASVSVTGSYAPSRTPLAVNIAPRMLSVNGTIPTTGDTAPFIGQILWTDGSTTLFGDPITAMSATPPPPLGVNATFSEASGATPGLTLDGHGNLSTFTIAAGSTGPFQVDLVVEGSPSLSDHAKITIS